MNAIAMTTDRLAVTIAEASRMTSLSRGTIRSYARTGRIKTVKVGRRRIVPISALERLVRLGVDSQQESVAGRAERFNALVGQSKEIE
jgi:excisionase family DNA binding protein